MKKLRIMAGIFASLLALFGLGGCRGGERGHPSDTPPSYNFNEPEMPEMLDGPSMYFDPQAKYIDKLWTDPTSNQTLFFTRDTLTLKDGDQTIWEGAWEIKLIDGYIYAAQSATGEAVGDYAYFTADYYTLPENAPVDREYLAAYPTNRSSDEEYVLFERNQ